MAVCLVVAGIARIAATWGVFNETWDEGVHVAAGTEWLQRGAYTYDPVHPPLARVAAALGPWLAGTRVHGPADADRDARQVLHAGNRYTRNLALARAGILPFFLLAALVVWAWTRELHGEPAALAALFVFTTLPPVLAHAGLATTDMALTATLPVAAYAMHRWLQVRSAGRAAAAGVAAGLAILSKLSALGFLPAIAAAMWLLQPRRDTREAPAARTWLCAGLALGIAALVVWAGYRFDTGALASADDDGPWQALSGVRWLPAPALFRGVRELADAAGGGHLAYLLGQVSTDGWWYFFPLALAVKTPLATLALLATGAAAAIGARARAPLAPLACAVVVLAMAMPSHLNIGVRHVLPLYAFAAIVAGQGCAWLASRARRRKTAAAVLGALLAGQAGASVTSHPDYLAYFNPLAGAHPEDVLVDSDLDWGQDLVRLGKELRARGVQRVALCYAGTMDPGDAGLPTVVELRRYQPVRGWIAISQMCLKFGGFAAPYDGYRWLENYEPLPWAGPSMRLYHVPVDETRTWP